MITFARVMDTTTGEIRAFEGAEVGAGCCRQAGHVVWIDMQAPDEQDIAVLKAHFDIHPLTLEDIRHAHQRPKLEQYPGYLELVLYEFAKRPGHHATMHASEITLLVGKDFVVSVHPTATPVIGTIVNCWAQVPELASETASYLAYLLIDAAVDTYFPVIEAGTDRLAELEDAVMASATDEVLASLFTLKKRLLHVRRHVTPLRDVFLAMMRGPGSYFGTKTYIYYQDVLDHLLRVADAIDLQRDLLGSTVDLYMSSLSNRTNDTMKKLTVLSTVLMTSALIAGIYGMNFKTMPELLWPHGYHDALWLMATSSWLLTALFRWRHYIGTNRKGTRASGIALIALGGFICLAWGSYLWSPEHMASVATRAEYLALQPGMDVAAAELVLGEKGEETSCEDTGTTAKQVYTWNNADGSFVTVTFENGKLATKACEKLRR